MNVRTPERRVRKHFTLAKWIAEWLAGKRTNESVSGVVRKKGAIYVQVENKPEENK